MQTNRRLANARERNTTATGVTGIFRFIKQEQYVELVGLYHLARTALAGQDDSRHARMVWASKEFAKQHPEVSSTGAYKDLFANLQGY